MFDAGGTLFDLKPSKAEVFHKVLRENGFDAPLESVAKLVAEAERKFDARAAALDGINEGWFWEEYDGFVLDRLGYSGSREKFSRGLSSEFGTLAPNADRRVG